MTVTNKIQSFQNDANDLVDKVSDQAQPALKEAAAKVEELRVQSLKRVRELAATARDQAARTKERTVGYIQDEPLKSVLIAGAVGAGVALLVRAFSGRGRD